MDIGQPMTAHEIERWISANRPALHKQITAKCYDYVRIILSLSGVDNIVRYKPVTIPLGSDHRCAYYGLADAEYDPAVWIRTNAHSHRPRPSSGNRKAATPKVANTKKAVNEAPRSLPTTPGVPAVHQVNASTVANAWETLSRIVAPADAFWVELVSAIAELKAWIQAGTPAPLAVPAIIQNHEGLVHPLIAHDVQVILTNEAHETRDDVESLYDMEAWVW
jgi:hypothetical protein